MLLVVTGIGSLIHIYSIGYMAHEGGYYRFFAYLNLFMFFMLTLVLAANYLLLFVGWEGVGLCSYLLIGFYFDKKFATNAGNKAFIVNRIGDFGFSLAMFLIVRQFRLARFRHGVHQAAPGASEATLTTIALLLLVGACGKSAQIPLYVWLPDAMAGPTPVSALIHAATMVTAGVYMIARSWAIYTHAPAAMNVIAIIGIATAFFAATIGLAQNDIKKVFAYSTVSQLGYMFVGVGVGAFSAGIFHLMTHAFFKALLFLGAGSVIHALSGEQDMRNMGGLRTKIPWTFCTMMCAAVAIAGVPPFSGFFSKDAILRGGLSPRALDVLGGRGDRRHDRVLRLPRHVPDLLRRVSRPRASARIAARDDRPAGRAGAAFARRRLSSTCSDVSEQILPHRRKCPRISPWSSSRWPSASVGIALAYLMYVAKPGMADSLAGSVRGLYTLVYNKYFVDEIYDAAVVKPVVGGSREVLWKGVDAGVHRWHRQRRGIAWRAASAASCAACSPAIFAAMPPGCCSARCC